MATQSFTYERQVQHDERLVMGCRTSRIGRKSLDFTYELWGPDGRAGHGLSTLVAFDYAANATIEVPAEWRRRIAAFESRRAAGVERQLDGRRWILRTLVPPAPTGMPLVIAIVSPGEAWPSATTRASAISMSVSM